MPKNPAALTSNRQDWTTPPELFAALDAEFDFALDAAASHENALCAWYLTAEDDALTQNWRAATERVGAVFVNPPYADLARWIEKCAYEADQRGITVVLLCPTRTDTRAWHEHIINRPNTEVRFIKGRLRFGGLKVAAPFPSAVVVFRPAPVQAAMFGGDA